MSFESQDTFRNIDAIFGVQIENPTNEDIEYLQIQLLSVNSDPNIVENLMAKYSLNQMVILEMILMIHQDPSICRIESFPFTAIAERIEDDTECIEDLCVARENIFVNILYRLAYSCSEVGDISLQRLRKLERLCSFPCAKIYLENPALWGLKRKRVGVELSDDPLIFAHMFNNDMDILQVNKIKKECKQISLLKKFTSAFGLMHNNNSMQGFSSMMNNQGGLYDYDNPTFNTYTAGTNFNNGSNDGSVINQNINSTINNPGVDTLNQQSIHTRTADNFVNDLNSRNSNHSEIDQGESSARVHVNQPNFQIHEIESEGIAQRVGEGQSLNIPISKENIPDLKLNNTHLDDNRKINNGKIILGNITFIAEEEFQLPCFLDKPLNVSIPLDSNISVKDDKAVEIIQRILFEIIFPLLSNKKIKDNFMELVKNVYAQDRTKTQYEEKENCSDMFCYNLLHVLIFAIKGIFKPTFYSKIGISQFPTFGFFYTARMIEVSLYPLSQKSVARGMDRISFFLIRRSEKILQEYFNFVYELIDHRAQEVYGELIRAVVDEKILSENSNEQSSKESFNDTSNISGNNRYSEDSINSNARTGTEGNSVVNHELSPTINNKNDINSVANPTNSSNSEGVTNNINNKLSGESQRLEIEKDISHPNNNIPGDVDSKEETKSYNNEKSKTYIKQSVEPNLQSGIFKSSDGMKILDNFSRLLDFSFEDKKAESISDILHDSSFFSSIFSVQLILPRSNTSFKILNLISNIFVYKNTYKNICLGIISNMDVTKFSRILIDRMIRHYTDKNNDSLIDDRYIINRLLKEIDIGVDANSLRMTNALISDFEERISSVAGSIRNLKEFQIKRSYLTGLLKSDEEVPLSDDEDQSDISTRSLALLSRLTDQQLREFVADNSPNQEENEKIYRRLKQRIKYFNDPFKLKLTSKIAVNDSRIENQEKVLKSSITLLESIYNTILRLITVNKKLFLNRNIFSRISQVLGGALHTFVGPGCSELLLPNKTKYNYDPLEILLNIMQIIGKIMYKRDLALQSGLDYKLVEKGFIICKKKGLIREDRVDVFSEIIEALKSIEDVDTIDEEIPEEFLDPLTFSLMDNPVRLLTSNATIDKSTFNQIMLNDQIDPFSRKPLDESKCIVDSELKDKIDKFKANLKSKMK